MDYYNDNDPHAAAWLRNLRENGLIPEGIVDERPIQEVKAEDVRGYQRCHFFAGIGGWSHALALAGWPADGPVCWTGSCPCQPFSTAGKRREEEDARDLWPVFFRLIAQCRPTVVLGEQIAGDAGYRWLARVQTDMESQGYRVGAADLPAACVGSPHIRQRLFWVANANGRQSSNGRVQRGRQHGQQQEDGGTAGGLEHTNGQRREAGAGAGAGGITQPFWADFDLVPCRDDKVRRVEPGSFPLVNGSAFRLADGRTREGVSRAAVLRGIGNAIVPQVAAAFIRAFLEVSS